MLKVQKRDYFKIKLWRSESDNKTFWKTEAPSFSNKFKRCNDIVSTEDSKFFDNFFNSILKNLKIPTYENLLRYVSMNFSSQQKLKRHPNIQKIKESSGKMTSFYFRHENCDNKNCEKILKIIQNLHSKKATRQGLPLESQRKTNLFFQNFCLKSLVFVMTVFNFLMDFKKLTLSLFTRRITLSKKLITDQWLHHQYYRYLLNVTAQSNLWVYR